MSTAGWRRWAAFGLTNGRALARDLEAALAGIPAPPACLARVRPALAQALRAGAAPGQRVSVRIFLAQPVAAEPAGWGFFLVERPRRVEVYIYQDGQAPARPARRGARP